MTRIVTIHDEIEILKPRKDKLLELSDWIKNEVEDAASSRAAQESLWRECLRDYEAIPKNPVNNVGIENAPNIVVPVSMMAVDIFNSIAQQTLFSKSPFVTVKQIPGKSTDFQTQDQEKVRALQSFVDWGNRHEFNPKGGSENASLDRSQLGTGILYSPWIQNVRKTRVHKITSAHPRIFSWPLEDFFVPGGAYDDIDQLQWIGLRAFHTWSYLNEMAINHGWKVDQVAPVGTVGWVRSRREQISRTTSNTKLGSLYEIFDIYAYYDIDGDGIREDLLITWDRTTRSILKLRFNPYDRRPFNAFRYQRRGYLFYGMGMVEKLRSLQKEMSDIHNHRNLNMLLANTRFWKARTGAGIAEEMKMYPNKVVMLQNPKEDLIGEQLGEVYPSSAQAEQISTQMADRLVGIGEMAQQKPSSLLSSRTPATTAALGFQQQSSRFAASFNSERDATAGAVKQCLWRYQEKVQAGDQSVIRHIQQVLGPQQAPHVINMLTNENFDESVIVEITATDERTSRQAEQQGMIQVGQLLLQYYEKVMQLGQIAATPEVPQPLRDIALKISEAAGEIVERTMKAFDTVRDPEAFRIKIEDEIDNLGIIASGNQFQQLQGLVSSQQQLGPEDPQGAETVDNSAESA